MESATNAGLLLLLCAFATAPCLAQSPGAAKRTSPRTDDDPALKASPVLSDPGPKYAGSTRIFQGIPGIERAGNGRLWATWYGGGKTEGPENYVMLATSDNNGKTWSDVMLVIDPPGDVRAFDPCLWHDPTGRLWLFWAQGHSLWDGRGGVWAIVTDEPESASPKWSGPRRLCHGVMMNKPTVLSTGEWLLPASVWSHKPINLIAKEYAFDLGKLSGSHAVCSTDKGKTWKLLGLSDVKGRSCDEHMIVERKDGMLWMLIRTKYGIGESVSCDRGKTWSTGGPSKTVTHIDSSARFFIRRLASGKLLLVKHAPPTGKGRSHLAAFVSDDDGKTWQGGLMLDKRPGVSYPDGVQAPDGTIYIIYDYSRHRAKQILMATFTEDDVAKGKCVTGKARLRVLVNQATGKRPGDFDAGKLEANEDGQALPAGDAAKIEPVEGKLAKVTVGATLFTDRKYVFRDRPGFTEGRTFIQSSIDRTRAVCRKAGVVYVVTPQPSRNKDSVAKALLDLGFTTARVPEFILFGDIMNNVCTVYQKRVEVGEEIEFGKWGVLIF